MRQIALLLLLLLSCVRVPAQVVAVPPLINFQGRLAKPNGTPVPDGTYSIRFSLWDADAGGSEKWNQTFSAVTVRNGAFAVLFAGFPDGTFDGHLWLEVKLGDDAPLTPRQQLVTVAYAMKANSVPDNAITTPKIAQSAVTSGKIAAGAVDSSRLAYDGASLARVSNSLVRLNDGGDLLVQNFLRLLSSGIVFPDGTVQTTAAPALPFQPQLAIALPPIIYALEGREANVYWDGILRSWLRLDLYNIDVDCAKGRQEEKRWTFTPGAGDVGSHAWRIGVGFNGVQLLTASTTLRVVPASAGTGVRRQLLLVGDSTTANGIFATELLNLFGASDPMDVTLVGTQGNGAVRHEGWSGRTYRWFRTDAASPFVFNGVFDFGSYQATHSIAMEPGDWVIFHLGVNDVFHQTQASVQARIEQMRSDLDAMIANIQSTVPGVRIGLCLTIPPAASQDAFGANYGTTYWRDNYLQNIGRWREAMIAAYAGREGQGIYLIPLSLNVDTTNNFPTASSAANARNSTSLIRQNNGVHPAQSGYWQAADAVHAALKAQEP